MNLPTTSENLQPEEWLQVMSLIHPDNVEETLRILHAHQPMIDALENLCKLQVINDMLVPEDAAGILNNEPNRPNPWPPEPQPEQEATEPARA